MKRVERYVKDITTTLKRDGIIVLLIALSLISIHFITAIGHGQNLPSDLVVPSDGILITGPDFNLKGNILVTSGGTLEIVDTTFTIYQDHDRQFGISLEQGATLHLVNSTLKSRRPLDIGIGSGSVIIFERSNVDIPGKLIGTPDTIRMENSVIKIEEINIQGGSIVFKDCTVMGVSLTITSQDCVIEDSIFNTPVFFHDDSVIKMKGSAARRINTLPGAVVEVYSKVNIILRDIAGVPISGATIRASQFNVPGIGMQLFTDNEGEWEGYLHSESIRSDGTVYLGNYIFECHHMESTATGSLSLKPIEEYTSAQLSSLELYTRLELSFPRVLPATAYYHTGETDLIISGNNHFLVTTYPGAGIPTYIHEGNLFITESGRLTISQESDFKLLQGERNHRIELRDGAHLTIGKNALLTGDRSPNIYLHDSSRLVIDGGTLEANIIAVMDSATMEVTSGVLKANMLYFHGGSLHMDDSSVYGKKSCISADSIHLRGVSFDLHTDIRMESPSMVIDDSNFNTPLLLFSDGEEVSLQNVTSPSIIPDGDLFVYRSWHLSFRIINTMNMLVPDTNLSIYRITGEELELVEQMSVPVGRGTLPLLGELITSESTKFLGNYLLRATKTVGAGVYESRDTMIALNGNRDAVLKFEQHFPYSLNVVLDIPDRIFNGNESFTVTGHVFYQGADIQVSDVLVDLYIIGHEDMKWSSLTDENGSFTFDITAPPLPGKHTLTVKVTDPHMQMSTIEQYTINVDGEDVLSLRKFMFESTIGIIITLILIITLIVLAYVIITWPTHDQKPSLTDSSTEELIRWAEKVKGKC